MGKKLVAYLWAGQRRKHLVRLDLETVLCHTRAKVEVKASLEPVTPMGFNSIVERGTEGPREKTKARRKQVCENFTKGKYLSTTYGEYAGTYAEGQNVRR